MDRYLLASQGSHERWIGAEDRLAAFKRVMSQADNEGVAQAVAARLQYVSSNNDNTSVETIAFARGREEDELKNTLKNNILLRRPPTRASKRSEGAMNGNEFCQGDALDIITI